MKRIVCIVVCLALICGAALAENKDRIADLLSEASGHQRSMQQYEQALEQTKIRLYEIRGAIGELRRQDTEEVERKKKEEDARKSDANRIKEMWTEADDVPEEETRSAGDAVANFVGKLLENEDGSEEGAEKTIQD